MSTLLFSFILFLKLWMLAASFAKCVRLSNYQQLQSILSKYYITGYTCNQDPKMKTLSEWSFSQFNLLNSFPIDPVVGNYVRKVPKYLFSRVKPEPLRGPLHLVSVSEDALTNILDLDPSVKSDSMFAMFVAGNHLLPGSDPMAHRYGGYQFGYWADQLGDGRAIQLGEYINSIGERWELQLKGAGKTPYSRNGDGRAVLRSSIREFLCSEAMDSLGIPSSRAAALVVSNDMVIRDQFYNGRNKLEPAAVVLRLAKSWFRIGSLEILQKEKELANLKQVVDFVIKHCCPELSQNDYIGFFQKVVQESALLVAKWMACGFTHGVLNTDNMSLLSITIDYGPFGFLDDYDPYFVPNHSDDEGRYSYENQPKIFKWNLACLGTALEPLLAEEEKSQLSAILSQFEVFYRNNFLHNFRMKLGIPKPGNSSKDIKMIQMLLDMMELSRADFTQTFRQLSRVDLNQVEEKEELWALKKIWSNPNFKEFIELYREMLNDAVVTEEERRSLMDRTNPQYVLRNWMAEAAIRQAEKDDFHLTNVLLKILRKPYTLDEEAEELGFSNPPPSWSGSLRVSCSS